MCKQEEDILFTECSDYLKLLILRLKGQKEWQQWPWFSISAIFFSQPDRHPISRTEFWITAPPCQVAASLHPIVWDIWHGSCQCHCSSGFAPPIPQSKIEQWLLLLMQQNLVLWTPCSWFLVWLLSNDAPAPTERKFNYLGILNLSLCSTMSRSKSSLPQMLNFEGRGDPG